MNPSDCILAFGIPTSEAEFWESKDDTKRDFVNRCCPVWQVYRFDVVSHVKEVEPHFHALGVNVVHGLTLSNLSCLLTSNSTKTIILFSHWQDDSVEFFDGMASSDAIVSKVPAEFAGIIDLCVCHPIDLVIKLRKRLHPDALVKFTDKKNTPHKWLYFYWAVFQILAESNISYLEALKRGVEEFGNI